MKDSSFHSASISTVSAFTQTKFAKLKEKICRLKMILDEQNQIQKCDDDEFIIHQQLDENNMYVKLIPKDNNNVFRAFSDALTFSQSKLLDFKRHLLKYLTKYPNQINKLLESVSEEGIPADEYLQQLRKGSVDQEDLKLQEEYFDMGFDKRRIIRVCLLNDNKFDTVYSQSFIDKAAVCQNILNNVINTALKSPNDEQYSSDEDELDISFEEPIVFYKNVEYTIWKQKQRKNNLRKRLPKDVSSRNSIVGQGHFRSTMPIKIGSLGGNESILMDNDKTFAPDQTTVDGKEISLANIQKTNGYKNIPKFQPSSGIEGMMSFLNQPSEALRGSGNDTLNPANKKLAQVKPSDQMFNFDPQKDFILTGESPGQDLMAQYKVQQPNYQNQSNIFKGPGPTLSPVNPSSSQGMMQQQNQYQEQLLMQQKQMQMLQQQMYVNANGQQNMMMNAQQFQHPQQMVLNPNSGQQQMMSYQQFNAQQMQQMTGVINGQQNLAQQPQQPQQPQQQLTQVQPVVEEKPGKSSIPYMNPKAPEPAQPAQPAVEEDINERLTRKAEEAMKPPKKKVRSRKHSHDSLISQGSRVSSRKAKKKNMKVLNRSLESITKNIDSLDGGDSLISSGQSSSSFDDEKGSISGGSDEVFNPGQTDDKKSSKLLNTASLRAKGRSEENQQIRELEYIKKTISDLKRTQNCEPIMEEDIADDQQHNVTDGFHVKTINLRRTPLEKISEVDSSSSIASYAHGLFQSKANNERFNQLYGENEDLRMSQITGSEMVEQRSVFGERHESDKALNKYVPHKTLANQNALMKMYQSSSEDQQIRPRGQLNTNAARFVPKQKKFGAPPGFDNFSVDQARTNNLPPNMPQQNPFQPMMPMPFMPPQQPVMQLPLTAGNLAQMQMMNGHKSMDDMLRPYVPPPLAPMQAPQPAARVEPNAQLKSTANEFIPKSKQKPKPSPVSEQTTPTPPAQAPLASSPTAPPKAPPQVPQMVVQKESQQNEMQKEIQKQQNVVKEEKKEPVQQMQEIKKEAAKEEKEDKNEQQAQQQKAQQQTVTQQQPQAVQQQPASQPPQQQQPGQQTATPQRSLMSMLGQGKSVNVSASPQIMANKPPGQQQTSQQAQPSQQQPSTLSQLRQGSTNGAPPSTGSLMQLKAASMPQKPSAQVLAKYRQNQAQAKDDNASRNQVMMGMAPGQSIQNGEKLTTIMYQMPQRAQSPSSSTQLGLSNLVASKPQFQSIQPFNAPSHYPQGTQILSARSTSGAPSQSFQAIPTGSSTGVMYVTPGQGGGPTKLQMMASMSNSVVAKPMPTNTPLPYAKSVGGLNEIRAGSTPAPPSAALLAAYKKKKEEQTKKAAAAAAEGNDQDKGKAPAAKKNSSQSLASMNSDAKSLKSADKGYGFQKISIPRVQGRQYGKLKFFDEGKKYGFILAESDHSDIFVHFDDLKKANLSEEILRQSKTNYMLTFSFNIMSYYGKYKYSKKAVDVKLEKCEPMGLVKQGGVKDQGLPIPRALSQKSPPALASVQSKSPFVAEESFTSIDQSKV